MKSATKPESRKVAETGWIYGYKPESKKLKDKSHNQELKEVG
ncbi:hypothetical protein [Flavobacterium branchiophilum]|nr:hypothetical protein [Flavobacterium branchiophilum]